MVTNVYWYGRITMDVGSFGSQIQQVCNERIFFYKCDLLGHIQVCYKDVVSVTVAKPIRWPSTHDHL